MGGARQPPFTISTITYTVEVYADTSPLPLYEIFVVNTEQVGDKRTKENGRGESTVGGEEE